MEPRAATPSSQGPCYGRPPRPHQTAGSAPRPASLANGRRRGGALFAAVPGTTPHQVLRVNEEAVEEKARGGWDPEGLFQSEEHRPRGGLIAARDEARRRAAAAISPSIALEDQRIHLANTRTVQMPEPKRHSTAVRPGPADQLIPPPGPAREALEGLLASEYVPVNLDYPGLRLLYSDPPIFAVDNFLPAQQCQAFIATALASDLLQSSKVGAGYVADDHNDVNLRRTSLSMLLDGMISARHPEFKALMQVVQGAAWRLTDGGLGWGRIGMMPAPGQYTFESPQLARYEGGQHFLSHQDAFPADVAAASGFQRHATVLVYLNDVSQGGETRFDHLGLSVRPCQGMALLFFPSFADGVPDDRALHTAEEALDTKWIMQQWVARGWGSGIPRKSPHQSTPASPDSRASPVSGTQAPERPARKRGTRARGRSAQHKASGF